MKYNVQIIVEATVDVGSQDEADKKAAAWQDDIAGSNDGSELLANGSLKSNTGTLNVDMVYQKIGTNTFVRFGADESSSPGYYEVRRNARGGFDWYGTSPYSRNGKLLTKFEVEHSGQWSKCDLTNISCPKCGKLLATFIVPISSHLIYSITCNNCGTDWKSPL